MGDTRQIIIRDHDQAFRNAIEKHEFRMFGDSDRCVDNWMYMYSKINFDSQGGSDVFKNKNTRKQILVDFKELIHPAFLG